MAVNVNVPAVLGSSPALDASARIRAAPASRKLGGAALTVGAPRKLSPPLRQRYSGNPIATVIISHGPPSRCATRTNAGRKARAWGPDSIRRGQTKTCLMDRIIGRTPGKTANVSPLFSQRLVPIR